MNSSISSSFPNTPVTTANAAPSSAAAPQSGQATNGLGDTVTLSQSQRVRQLYAQGLKVSQIASNLSLPVEIVNSYLGISGSTG